MEMEMEIETQTENIVIEMKQCTNCKVKREINNFIGKSGDFVKRCLKCREKDAKQKKDRI